MGGVKLSSPPFTHVRVNKKPMAEWNKKLTTWLERVCPGVWREAEVAERRGLFCGDGAGQKAGSSVYSSSLLANAVHTVTEVRDVSEQMHLQTICD